MLKWSNISNGLRFSCKSIFGRFDSLGKRTIRYSPWCKRTRYYSTSFLSESLVLTIFEGDFLNPFALIRKRLANSGLGLLTQRLGGNLHSDRCQTNALICTPNPRFLRTLGLPTIPQKLKFWQCSPDKSKTQTSRAQKSGVWCKLNSRWRVFSTFLRFSTLHM